MNNLSLKEKAILATLGVIALYVIAALTWFLHMDITKKTGAWYKAREGYRKACDRYRRESQLIPQRDQWTEDYESEKAAMPVFADGKATDTVWLGKMDALATKHHIVISQRQSGKKETISGDVRELELEVRSWEGALESLVKFMHELENSDQGMFDFSSLVFKPSSRKGYLKGTMTITCAYMRE